MASGGFQAVGDVEQFLGPTSDVEAFDGLASDRGDEFKVLVNVQDGEAVQHCGSGDQHVRDR